MALRLGTAETVYRAVKGASMAEAAALRCWVHRHVVPDFRRTMAQNAAVQVYVNHGRWLVRCPACGSCQVAAETDRKFFCANCLNHHVGGQWLPALWPPLAARHAIETLLGRRAIPNQNMLPGETVETLARENAEHGL